jgi:excisionase family DNA binding protein
MARNKQPLPNHNGKPRRWASIPAGADYLNAHPSTIRLMIRQGRLKAYRSGTKLIRIDLNELDALMGAE